MANKEAVFSLRVDTGNSVKDVQDFDQSINKLNKDMQDTQKTASQSTGTDTFSKKLDEMDKKLASGTLTFREMSKLMKEYQTVAAQAGTQTPVGDRAIKAAASLKDTLTDLQTRTKLLSSDYIALDTAVAGIQTGTAAFQGFQSVVALTGVESEALVQTMVKLQAAQGLVNSVNQIALALNKDAILGIQVRTALEKVYTFAVAQTTAMTNAFNGALGRTAIGQKLVAGSSLLAAGAMKVLNFVMSLNPVLLIVTGIGLLVGALAYFLSGTDEATAANERLNASIDKQNDAFDRNTENLKKNATNRRRLLVANGADEEELHKDTLKRLKEEETNRQKQVKQTEKQLERRRKVLKMAYEEEDEELIKSIKKQINADRKKYNQLVANRKEYDIAVKEENKRYNDLTEKDEKEEADKQKARQEKYAADRKSILDKIRQQEQEYHDSFLSDQDREIIAVQRKYDQLVKEAKKYKLNTTELENSRLNDINEINTKYEDQRLKNEEETEKERLAKIAEREQKNLELLKAYQQLVLDEYAKQLVDFEYTQAEQSKKLSEALANNVITEQQFMDAQLELEKQYAEKEKEINNAKNEAIKESNAKRWEQETKTIEKMLEYGNMAMQQLNAINGLLNQIGENRLNTIKDQQDAELHLLDAKQNAALNNENLTAEQKTKIEKDFAQQKYQVQLKAFNEEDKIKKAQFARDKSLRIAQAAIDTAGNIITSIKNAGGIPAGIPFGIAAAALGATQIATIAAQKYQGGTAPGAPSLSTSAGASTGAGASTFTANTNAQQTETAALIGGQGQQGGVTQVVVVESDITNVQNKVSAQQALSTY